MLWQKAKIHFHLYSDSLADRLHDFLDLGWGGDISCLILQVSCVEILPHIWVPRENLQTKMPFGSNEIN